MNVITIPIYQRRVIPANINILTEYSGTGLCNQLFHIMVSIDACNFNNDTLYCDFLSRDWLTGKMIPMSEILDFFQLKQKHNWNLKNLSSLPDQEIPSARVIPNGGGMWSLHQNNLGGFIDIAQKLIFNPKIENIAKKIIEKTKLRSCEVNLVHLRIDKDVETHIEKHCGGKAAFEKYVEYFRKAINEHCSLDKKLVLLLEDVHHPLVQELCSKYDVVFFDKQLVKEISTQMVNSELIEGREMYALIDLLIGKNLVVNTFICANGPIFTTSFGVLLKYINDYNKIVCV